ncbi:MAG: hypothetical protein LBQ14_09550 [Treponema sp.]|jgi:hypothetical protein|nr:hypothetical protein [Treponema sp.]
MRRLKKTALCLLFMPALFPSCFQPAGNLKRRGEGLIALSLAGPGGGARTLFPGGDGISYTAVFEEAGGAVKSFPLADGNGGVFSLPPGVWNLTVTAKKDGGVIASGGAAGLEIAADKKKEIVISIQPVNGGASGILDWSVEYPAGVTEALLFINAGEDGGALDGSPVDITEAAAAGNLRAGSRELVPGSYLLRVRLTASGSGISAGTAEAAQIYPGLTTSAAFRFSEADFTEGTAAWRVLLAADSSQNAYTLINAKGYGYETPDQQNSGHLGVPHITQEHDSVLGKDVFAFTLHRDLDGNATGDQTRQRVEIKVDDSELRGAEDRTFVYRWKFKLPPDFAPSTAFTHIHQIKNEGGDSSAPVITLSPRLVSGAGRMQLIYRAPTHNYGGASPVSSPNRYLAQVPLADFLGEWVQAEEHIAYASTPEDSAYGITITRMSDGAVLLSWTYTPQAYGSLEEDTVTWPFITWRSGNNYGRPKYGVYRLIWNDSALTDPVGGLKDEKVLYADFELERQR